MTFVETATGAVAATTTMRAEILPDSFGIPTTMLLAGNPWIVDSADPGTRKEYESTGRLTLSVTRENPEITFSPPNVLFDMPTLNAILPEMAPEPPGERCAAIQDNDWRDVEVVHPTHAEFIEATFTAVRDIYVKHQQGEGFGAVHTRRAPAEPLAPATLTVAAVHAAFGDRAGPVTRLRLHDYRGVVAGGFAFITASKLLVYGMATGANESERIVVLGLDPWRVRDAADGVVIGGLLEASGLDMVVWRQGRRLRTADEVTTWLRTITPA